jgi:hypothetical protein
MKLFALLIFTNVFVCIHGFALPPADLNSDEITGPREVSPQQDEGSVYNLSTAFSNSLARAVSSIGKAKAVLNVDADTVVAADLMIPANIVLNFPSTAMISVDVGKTLTISAMTSPGNRKIFTGSGNVRLGAQAVERLNLTWWAGTDTSVDATNAVNSALGSLSYSKGGVLYVPCGTWLTSGGHTISDVVTIEGCGDHPDASSGTTFLLTNNKANFVFKIRDWYRTVKIRDLAVDLGKAAATSGILLQGTAPNTGVGFDATNVSIHANLAGPESVGINLDASDGHWDMEQVSFTNLRVIPPINGIGVRINTHNASIRFDSPWFYLPNGSTAIKAVGSANVKVTQPSFLGSTSPPPAPVETLNRTATASIPAGTSALTLTSGSLTENDIGQKVVIAGKLDSYITDVLTEKTATVANNAGRTASGDAISIYRASPGTGQAYAAFWNAGDYTNIEIENSQDEGVQYFFINSGNNPNTGVITFRNSYIQGIVKQNADAIYTSIGNHYFSQTFEDSPGVTTVIHSFGDDVMKKMLYYAFTGHDRAIARERLIGPISGVARVVSSYYGNFATKNFQTVMPERIWHSYASSSSSPDLTEPVVSIGSANSFVNAGKPLLELASLDDSSNKRSLTYRFWRNPENGYLTVSGSQKGFVGYDFNGPIYSSSGGVRSASVQLTDGATITADPKDGENFYVTLGGNRKLQVAPMTEADQGRIDGATIQFELIQDGIGNRNVSLATGTAGQFAFGTDIPQILLTTTPGKRDILTAKYSKRLDRWMVIDFKRGF